MKRGMYMVTVTVRRRGRLGNLLGKKLNNNNNNNNTFHILWDSIPF